MVVVAYNTVQASRTAARGSHEEGLATMRMETGNQAIASQQCWGLAGSGTADPSVGAGTLAETSAR